KLRCFIPRIRKTINLLVRPLARTQLKRLRLRHREDVRVLNLWRVFPHDALSLLPITIFKASVRLSFSSFVRTEDDVKNPSSCGSFNSKPKCCAGTMSSAIARDVKALVLSSRKGSCPVPGRSVTEESWTASVRTASAICCCVGTSFLDTALTFAQ